MGVVMLGFFGLAFFYRFFADLCLIFMGLMFSFLALTGYFNFKISNSGKMWAANLIFFGSIIAVIR